MPSYADELFGGADQPSQGSSVQGTMSAKKKPTAWELFKSTPIVQGLREVVMAPIQAGGMTAAPEWLMRAQGVDPQTAKTVADLGRQRLAQEEEGALLRSRENYGGAPGYELSRGFARTAPIAAASGAAAAGLGVGASLPAALALGALEGAAGGFLEPVTNQSDLRDFWTTKAKQTGAGAVAGAAGSALGYGVGKVVERGAGAIKGNLRPGAAEVEKLGKDWGIRTTAGDVTGSPALQRTEVALESVPMMGMGKFRQAQNVEAGRAAQRIKADLTKQMEGMDWGDLSSVQAAAASGNRNAENVLAQIANAGDDWQRILQTSGNVKLVKNKLVADRLYDEVGKIAGDAPVPINSTMSAIQESKAELMKSAIPDEGALALLNRLEQRLQAQGENAVDLSYTGMGRLRSDLGDMVSDFYKGSNAATGSKGVGILARIKKAVEGDMETFAKSNPGTREAFKEANSFYQNNVVPFKDAALAKSLKDAPADTVFGKFIKASTTEGQAERFFNVLDPKGQAAVRVGMVSQALDEATREVASEAGAVFSPAQFAGALEKLKGARNVAFKGESKFELDGLVKIMRHVQRAGQFAENPGTGYRVIQQGMPVGLLAGAAYSPQMLIAGLTSGKAIQQLLTTKAGKRLLLSASASTPGTEAFNKMLQKTLPGLGGVFAGGATTDDPQPQAQPVMGGSVADQLYGEGN